MKKITVIDDDEELVGELADILKTEGYQVSTFTSTVFTQVIDTVNPDLLLIDVWFDDNKSGIPMVQAIRNQKHLAHIPIITMSSDENVAQYARKAGSSTYIRKPIRIENLLETIDKQLH